MKIILNPPDSKTPGYNKRSYQAAVFEQEFKKGVTPELFKQMVEFLSEYIIVQKDSPEEPNLTPYEALWEHASEDDMKTLMSAVSGGSAPDVPPVKSESSGELSQAAGETSPSGPSA